MFCAEHIKRNPDDAVPIRDRVSAVMVDGPGAFAKALAEKKKGKSYAFCWMKGMDTDFSLVKKLVELIHIQLYPSIRSF